VSDFTGLFRGDPAGTIRKIAGVSYIVESTNEARTAPRVRKVSDMAEIEATLDALVVKPGGRFPANTKGRIVYAEGNNIEWDNLTADVITIPKMATRQGLLDLGLTLSKFPADGHTHFANTVTSLVRPSNDESDPHKSVPASQYVRVVMENNIEDWRRNPTTGKWEVRASTDLTQTYLPDPVTVTPGTVLVARADGKGWESAEPFRIDAANLIAGTGTPASALGDIGDYFEQLDAAVDAFVIWGPKTEAGWPASATLRKVPDFAGLTARVAKIETGTTNVTRSRPPTLTDVLPRDVIWYDTTYGTADPATYVSQGNGVWHQLRHQRPAQPAHPESGQGYGPCLYRLAGDRARRIVAGHRPGGDCAAFIAQRDNRLFDGAECDQYQRAIVGGFRSH
jgi:hypothetical protein